MPRSPILVLGLSAVDVIARPVDSFPDRGGLRLFDDLSMSAGGCAVNVAVALARIGVGADIVAPVSADLWGTWLTEQLRSFGVPTDHLASSDAGTPVTLVAVSSDGERSFLHRPGGNRVMGADAIPDAILADRALVSISGSMIMDALDGPPLAQRCAVARHGGAVTVLDTVFDDNAAPSAWRERLLPVLPHLNWFVPSLPEARALTGQDDPIDAIRWCQDHGSRGVVVKCGGSAAHCAPEGEATSAVPPFPTQVLDATGAGDAWVAGFLWGLLDEVAPAEAVRRGHAVAHFCVQAVGAATGIPSGNTVMSLLRS